MSEGPRDVDPEPVDRERARGATLPVDELADADADADRRHVHRETLDQGHAVREHRRAAAGGLRRSSLLGHDRSGLELDGGAEDLRPADVEPDRDGHEPATSTGAANDGATASSARASEPS